MSNVEKELFRGVDYIETLIATYDRSILGNKTLERQDIERLLEHREFTIDSYAVLAIEEAQKALNDKELGVFTRELLKKTQDIKKVGLIASK